MSSSEQGSGEPRFTRADDDLRFLMEMPKAELHLHLDGSLDPSLALELAKTRGVEAPRDWAGMRAALVAPERCADQADLLRAFDLVVQRARAVASAEDERPARLAPDDVAIGLALLGKQVLDHARKAFGALAEHALGRADQIVLAVGGAG
jgi:hypothetical protein